MRRRFDTNMLLLKYEEEDTFNMAIDILQNLRFEMKKTILNEAKYLKILF